MPFYKSNTGREILLRLRGGKDNVKVGIEPQFFPQDDLDTQFPRHIVKVETLDEKVRKEINWQLPTDGKVRYLKDSLPSGSWEGKRCFIIGGGPSLRGFDFSCLWGEKIIAVNKAFVDVPFAEIQYSADYQFQEWINDPAKGGEKMAKAIKAWPLFQGHKVCLKLPGYVYPKDIEFVEISEGEGISESLEEGIYNSSNTGYGAINLAIALGANPIYLLGYDMKHDGKITHFHEGYPKPQYESQLKIFAKKFPKLAEAAKEKNIRIINLNKDSTLDCFEFGSIDDVLSYKKQKGRTYLQEILPTNSWANEECFIIGGGPSLKDFPFMTLMDKKVIAINRSFEKTPFANIMVSASAQFYHWLKNGKLGWNTLEAYKKFKGLKVWVDSQQYEGFEFGEEIIFTQYKSEEGISFSLEDGLCTGVNNSGYTALNLALALGANPIYLLGFDFYYEKEKAHHYEEYPTRMPEPAMINQAKLFEKYAPAITERKIQVFTQSGPFNPGITTSVNNKWIGALYSSQISRAASPGAASKTLYFCLRRISTANFRTSPSSSTTKIVSLPPSSFRF